MSGYPCRIRVDRGPLVPAEDVSCIDLILYVIKARVVAVGTEDEARGAKKVLSAAALTYVAALASTLAQLLRLIIISRGNRRN